MSITIEVLGTPTPKGSWRIVTNPRTKKPMLVPDNAKSKPWADAVKAAAANALQLLDAHGRIPFVNVPLALCVTFWVARPKGHYSTSLKHPGRLLPSAPAFPISTHVGDLDKLVRNAGDALSKLIFDDDSRIVTCYSRKRYADGREPGACIIVQEETGCDEGLPF